MKKQIENSQRERFLSQLIQGIIQNIITFDCTLNSWWTRIVVGLLTLFFIVIQRGLTSIKSK